MKHHGKQQCALLLTRVAEGCSPKGSEVPRSVGPDDLYNHPTTRMHCEREPQSRCSDGRDLHLETEVLVERDGADSKPVRNRHRFPRQWEHENHSLKDAFQAAEWTCHVSAILRKKVTVRKGCEKKGFTIPVRWKTMKN